MSEYPYHVVTGGLYGAVLVTPFLSADAIAQLYFELNVAAVSDPAWASLFIAGVAGDTMATLADADPWCHAFDDDFGGATLHGRPFGVLADHEDVVHERDPRHQKPYEMLAISEPLMPEAARLLGAAAGGRVELWHRIEDDGLTPQELVLYGAEAIRVALYRRSSILRVAPDPWAETVFMRWACWAANIRGGTPVAEVEALADAEIDAHKISDDQYLAATAQGADDAAFWRIVEPLLAGRGETEADDR